MAKTRISAKVDVQDKQDFEKVCNEIGISPSEAINIFIKFVIREQYIPSVLTSLRHPFFEEPNLSHIENALAQLKAGKGTVHELIEEDDE